MTTTPATSFGKILNNKKADMRKAFTFVDPDGTLVENSAIGWLTGGNDVELREVETNLRDDLNVYGRSSLLSFSTGSFSAIAGVGAIIYGGVRFGFGSMGETIGWEGGEKQKNKGANSMSHGAEISAFAAYELFSSVTSLFSTPVSSLCHKVVGHNLEEILSREVFENIENPIAEDDKTVAGDNKDKPKADTHANPKRGLTIQSHLNLKNSGKTAISEQKR